MGVFLGDGWRSNLQAAEAILHVTGSVWDGEVEAPGVSQSGLCLITFYSISKAAQMGEFQFSR